MYSFAYLFERFPSFVQTFVYRESEEMLRQGMNPWLVSIRRPEDPVELAKTTGAPVFYLPEQRLLRAEVDEARAARRLPWRVHRAIPKYRGQADSNRLFEAAWLGPQLRERGIGHVHAHFGGVAARTAWWLKKLYGISYSFTGHANDIFCESGMPISNAWLVRDATLVVTETDFAREWMQRNHHKARKRIFRVYNGIDADFPPRKPAGGVPRILSVGRLVEKKGFATLIEACGKLRENGLGFCCEIVGEGPLMDHLKYRIRDLGLTEHVRLCGPRSQVEVREFLARAQLFVLACVPEEGGGSDNLPTVVAEAMMCGLPVISTALAGLPEMIEDGVDGILVPPSDSASLSLAMTRALSDEGLCKRLSSAARKKAVSKFAVETTTRELKYLLVREAGIDPTLQALTADPDLKSAAERSWLCRTFGWRC